MISSVSFKGTESTGFQDLVSKPQSYAAPNAASEVGDKFEKKGSKLKTAGKVALGAAVAGALLLAGHKTGLTAKIPAVGQYIDKAGKFISDKAGAAVNFVKDKFASANVGETVAEAVEEAAEGVAGSAV